MSGIKDLKQITDYEAIPLLFHEKKELLLKLLIDNKLNIISIAKKLKMNPGTVRRHLDDLIAMELVELVETVKNNYGQKEKFYRASAKTFEININFKWPIRK